jgi:hypothetical protein
VPERFGTPVKKIQSAAGGAYPQPAGVIFVNRVNGIAADGMAVAGIVQVRAERSLPAVKTV